MTRLTPPSAALIADAWKRVEHLGSIGEKVTIGQLAADMHISIIASTTILRGWKKQGMLREVGGGNGRNRILYEVVPADERPTSPRRTAEQNLWDAMRGLNSFTPVDLMAHANTAEVEVTARKAADYCQQLLAGGYLRVEKKGTRTRPPAYRLIRKTGPQAPIERRVRAIIDPNTEEAHVLGIGGGK